MPKSKTRKKAAPRPDTRPEHLIAPDDDQPAPRKGFQAIAAAALALLIVVAMLVSAVLPFINWR